MEGQDSRFPRSQKLVCCRHILYQYSLLTFFFARYIIDDNQGSFEKFFPCLTIEQLDTGHWGRLHMTAHYCLPS